MKGILKHGYGNWIVIAIDADLKLAPVLKEEVADAQPVIVTGLPPFPATSASMHGMIINSRTFKLALQGRLCCLLQSHAE